MSLTDLQENNPLGAATLTGWRYPVVGGVMPGLFDIRVAADQSGPSFAGLSHGIFSQRFIQASLLAEQSLGADPEEYQPRLLDVPALQYAALWLHGVTTDFFISLLDGRPPGSAPLKDVNEIITDLRARASARLSRSRQVTPSGGSAPGTPTN